MIQKRKQCISLTRRTRRFRETTIINNRSLTEGMRVEHIDRTISLAGPGPDCAVYLQFNIHATCIYIYIYIHACMHACINNTSIIALSSLCSAYHNKQYRQPYHWFIPSLLNIIRTNNSMTFHGVSTSPIITGIPIAKNPGCTGCPNWLTTTKNRTSDPKKRLSVCIKADVPNPQSTVCSSVFAQFYHLKTLSNRSLEQKDFLYRHLLA